MDQKLSSAATAEDITAWIVDWIARELEIPAADIDPTRSILDYSLSSVSATILVGDLEEWLEIELTPTLVWDFPTITEITAHLLSEIESRRAAGSDDTASAKDMLANLDSMSDEEVEALLAKLAADDAGA